MNSVSVEIPAGLRHLSGAPASVRLELEGPVTLNAVIDALEAAWPALRGTVREHGSGRRRAYLRFFACGEDISSQPMDAELPAEVSDGVEALLIVGAVSGG